MRHIVVSAVLAATLQAAVSVMPAHAASVSVALDSVPNRDTSGTFRWADDFVKELGKLGWKTKTFPRDAIGGEAERLDQIRSGLLDVSMSDFGKTAQLDPEMRVVQLPYVFKNTDHEFRYFTKSHFLAGANKKLADKGVHIIAVVPNGGFLGIFNSKKPVHTVADMKGLRMRALDQSQLGMFKMMGASGVVIPFAEVPNAIQTGIADGYVNSAGVPLTFGQTELFKYYSNAKVKISARLAIASATWWKGLSAKEKSQIEAAANAASKDVFTWVDKVQSEQEKQLAAAKITVYNPTEKEIKTFRDATVGMKTNVPNVPQARVDEILKDIASFSK
jgi:TRAP-type transport system periplasmic protein